MNAIHIASGVLWIMWKTYPHFLWISLICAYLDAFTVDMWKTFRSYPQFSVDNSVWLYSWQYYT